MNRIMEDMLALEAAGSTSKETEVAVYARITDMAGLEKATSSEQHVQLESKFQNGTKFRMRKVTKPDGSVKFIATMKIREEGGGPVPTDTEHSVDVTEDFFEAFKHGANKMLVKTRYNFSSQDVSLNVGEGDDVQKITLPNVTYEVDVYTNPQGGVAEWCKIDVELDAIIAFIEKNHPEIKDTRLNISVSHLPFKPVQPILNDTQDPEKKALLGQIWDTQFNLDPKGQA
jgi:hypothetical protein